MAGEKRERDVGAGAFRKLGRRRRRASRMRMEGKKGEGSGGED